LDRRCASFDFRTAACIAAVRAQDEEGRSIALAVQSSVAYSIFLILSEVEGRMIYVQQLPKILE